MRRADRLFQIIQILRRTSKPITAAALGAEVEVSTRTIYRDVAHLIGQHVPIEGEPGFGYLLGKGYDMPPLMLTPQEIEAVVLGAQWVASRPDAALADAARDVIAKIAATVPDQLRYLVLEPGVSAKRALTKPVDTVDMSVLRLAIRSGRKLRLRYRTEAGAETYRTVWPVIVVYSETDTLLAAWCELRSDFRRFRVDRIITAEMMTDAIGVRRAELQRRWRVLREAELASLGDRAA